MLVQQTLYPMSYLPTLRSFSSVTNWQGYLQTCAYSFSHEAYSPFCFLGSYLSLSSEVSPPLSFFHACFLWLNSSSLSSPSLLFTLHRYPKTFDSSKKYPTLSVVTLSYSDIPLSLFGHMYFMKGVAYMISVLLLPT